MIFYIIYNRPEVKIIHDFCNLIVLRRLQVFSSCAEATFSYNCVSDIHQLLCYASPPKFGHYDDVMSIILHHFSKIPYVAK